MESQARLQQLLSYLDVDPNNINLIADAVDIYLQIGPLPKAHALLSQGLDVKADDARLLFQRSTLHIAEAQYEPAKDILQSLLKSGIENTGIRYNLALCLSMTGEMQEALDIMTESTQQPTQHFFAGDLLIVRLKHHAGDLDEALSLAMALLEQEPDNGDLNGVISLLFLDLDDRAQALHFAQKAQKNTAKNTESFSTIGHLALEDFDADKAKGNFQKILDIQPKDGRAWLGMGLAALLNQEMDIGEEHLVTATTFMPNHLGTWNTLAWLRILKKNIPDAKEALNAAMEKDRTFSENHGTLAVVQILENQREEAERSIKIALRLDPMCISAHFAQTLLLSPEKDQNTISERMESLMNRPIGEGQSMLKGLQRYASKNNNKGNNKKIH
ncbi:hypothetical protein A9Q81_07550 [Gammaproteobacteria bacterium 42_54_T18]|nr:hypothetical protein A9Q81_07550 [Gammaproteobacteria bacterium 42_54_T18]